MAPTILIVADSLIGDELARELGPAATRFAASLLADTVAVAKTITGARVAIRYGLRFPLAALAGLPAAIEAAPLRGEDGPALAATLAEALAAGGPALLLGADLPHLPPWRLRDALTHLAHGADLVIGPGDGGDWYLLGLRAPAPELLRAVPPRGSSPGGLARAAALAGRSAVALPAWYPIRTGGALASLAEGLRTMPPAVAAETRAALASEAVAARAVGG